MWPEPRPGRSSGREGLAEGPSPTPPGRALPKRCVDRTASGPPASAHLHGSVSLNNAGERGERGAVPARRAFPPHGRVGTAFQRGASHRGASPYSRRRAQRRDPPHTEGTTPRPGVQHKHGALLALFSNYRDCGHKYQALLLRMTVDEGRFMQLYDAKWGRFWGDRRGDACGQQGRMYT